VPVDVAMCERCNPLGLRQPAASQAHGTVVLGIIGAVVGLAILGKVALAGVGPFDGRVTAVLPDPPNLVVTLTVTNNGSREGSTTCRVFAASDSGIGPNQVYVLSPQIDAGATIAFSRQVTDLGSTVRDFKADCT
jgi:hypothetical protein